MFASGAPSILLSPSLCLLRVAVVDVAVVVDVVVAVVVDTLSSSP